MTRIDDTFAGLQGRPALVGFITAGDPTLAHSVPAMHALVAGGTDLIELGVPFSDPEAEGPAIQASSERALANGMTLAATLDLVAEFRQTNQHTPIVLMGYLNSILAMPNFAERAGQAGVDGLIMVNLPPEEGTTLRQELAAQNINLIYLVAPTTAPERAEYILKHSGGFVYAVSMKGTTGAGGLDPNAIPDLVRSFKRHTQLPVCVGFGIRDGATAGAIAAHADGVVVGSAIVQLMAQHETDVEACATALTDFAASLRQGIADR
ncbi:MAG: tryptophan synthase subunit alpha [Pseudomonadota bacterium]